MVWYKLENSRCNNSTCLYL